MYQLVLTVVSFLFGWIRNALPFIAGYLGAAGSQFLISLGVGITVFSGFNVATSYLIGLITSSFDTLPTYVLQFLGLIWVDKAMNLMLSTGFFLLTIKGLRAGSIARQGWWKPGQGSGSIPG
jgi:hypothetical protein